MRTAFILQAAAALTIALGAIACERKAGSTTTTASTTSTERCPHEIKKDKCPFCTPSLVESDGFCAEHGVAEALCYQCRPYLKAAFRAKGDWCKHEIPDSQCVQCHPELSEKQAPGAGHEKTGG